MRFWLIVGTCMAVCRHAVLTAKITAVCSSSRFLRSVWMDAMTAFSAERQRWFCVTTRPPMLLLRCVDALFQRLLRTDHRIQLRVHLIDFLLYGG